MCLLIGILERRTSEIVGQIVLEKTGGEREEDVLTKFQMN
jgi:hypothetical protein